MKDQHHMISLEEFWNQHFSPWAMISHLHRIAILHMVMHLHFSPEAMISRSFHIAILHLVMVTHSVVNECVAEAEVMQVTMAGVAHYAPTNIRKAYEA
jgi:hypothetical protein